MEKAAREEEKEGLNVRRARLEAHRGRGHAEMAQSDRSIQTGAGGADAGAVET
jgi:hypothetical protein